VSFDRAQTSVTVNLDAGLTRLAALPDKELHALIAHVLAEEPDP
jgi:hypothetical protein